MWIGDVDSLIRSTPRDPVEAFRYLSSWFDEMFIKYEEKFDNEDDLPIAEISPVDFENFYVAVKLTNAALNKTEQNEYFKSEFVDGIRNGSVLYVSKKHFNASQALRLSAVLEEAKRISGGLEEYFNSDDAEGPLFSLADDDVENIHEHTAAMREIVFISKVIDESHKGRILKRISQVEAEVLRRKGRFDVILGGLSDVGEAVGKFGRDVKPLVDRMNEIAKIVRVKTNEYDGLPAPESQKRLPAPDAIETDPGEE